MMNKVFPADDGEADINDTGTPFLPTSRANYDFYGVLAALDALASALAEHNHQWTPRERRLYETAVAYCDDAILDREARGRS